MSSATGCAAVVFWGGVAFCAYIYAGFFLILSLWARLRGERTRPDDAFLPSVSLLISAYNEEAVIARKLENALDLDYPGDKLEILLISDGSMDDTVRIAESFAGRGVDVLDYAERRGKNGALNAAIPNAVGDVLVFTDANTDYRPDAIRKLVRHFADPRVGLV
ncbi:MAG: glycosyltransferase, partial [Candidatus Nealsonbacteria bacterium]|nr:glycosyltransferase [Candidatus Nealsonbacteria bacterium]